MRTYDSLELLEWLDNVICGDNCIMLEEEDGGVIMQFRYGGETTTFIDTTLVGCLNQARKKYGP